MAYNYWESEMKVFFYDKGDIVPSWIYRCNKREFQSAATFNVDVGVTCDGEGNTEIRPINELNEALIHIRNSEMYDVAWDYPCIGELRLMNEIYGDDFK